MGSEMCIRDRFSVLLVALQSAPLVAAANEVCAGPFTRPAYSEVLDLFESDNAPKVRCPEGTTPIRAGSAAYPNYLLGYMKSEPLGNGKIRRTLDSIDYECLCPSGRKTGTGARYQ